MQIWGGTFFSNTCHQYCVCPAAPLLIFLIQNPLEVNYFKWRAIRNYYFILNCTGNVRLMADFCPWDSRGGVMENKVWDRTKPKMGIYTMSDTDITWPENLLWIYLLQKKWYGTKTSWTTIMSQGQKIHIFYFLRTLIQLEYYPIASLHCIIMICNENHRKMGKNRNMEFVQA